MRFSEKIQVKKLRSRYGLLVETVDKLKVKEYVQKVCPQIRTASVLWTARSLEELREFPARSMVNDYVIKSNCGSQDILIVKDGCHPSVMQLETRYGHILSKGERKSMYGEWPYEKIEPAVFCEEYLSVSGDVPADYKFFVYHGKAHFIQVDTARFTSHRRNMFDIQWQDIGIDYSHPRMLPSPPKPANLDLMIEAAERLGAPFDFARVDLYVIGDAIYFGEITHFPGGGFERFPTDYWDLKFGEPWRLEY